MNRQSRQMSAIAVLVSSSLLVYGCSGEPPTPRALARGDLAVSIEGEVEGEHIVYELAPNGTGDTLEGWATRTSSDGVVKQEWVIVPAMASTWHYTIFEEGGETFFGAPAADVRIPVREYVEEDGLLYVVLEGAGGQTASVQFTSSGDQPQFVCGGLCIAALIAGGMLALCGLAVTLLIINCSAQGRCWEVDMLKLDPDDFAICQGRCITWEN